MINCSYRSDGLALGHYRFRRDLQMRILLTGGAGYIGSHTYVNSP
ncbi:hypothetical protein TA5114_01030 [Cognatishimia activa]|uniref:Uncharacterized protein n=1 Tax=Cognatishimia activa TaxID=1715691 RepID=A0A0P1IVG7_9RHOB|nr:hypothetical protein TA5114_01030 [Cognatishimia activa]